MAPLRQVLLSDLLGALRFEELIVALHLFAPGKSPATKEKTAIPYSCTKLCAKTIGDDEQSVIDFKACLGNSLQHFLGG